MRATFGQGFPHGDAEDRWPRGETQALREHAVLRGERREELVVGEEAQRNFGG